MLVLTRKPGEKIKIGDDIVISVLDVGKGNVRIGIDAPRNITVMRDELFQRILQENVESSKRTSGDVLEASKLLRQKLSQEEE